MSLNENTVRRVDSSPKTLTLGPASPEQIIAVMHKRLDFAHTRGGAQPNSLITLTKDGEAEIIAKCDGSIGYALCLLHKSLPSSIELVDYALEQPGTPFRIGAHRVSSFYVSPEEYRQWQDGGKHFAVLSMAVLNIADRRWSHLPEEHKKILPMLHEQVLKIVNSFKEVIAFSI